MKRIIRNAARCKLCGDVIESNLVSDFIECSCGAMLIGGGKKHLRRAGDMLDIEELSETEDVLNGVLAAPGLSEEDFEQTAEEELATRIDLGPDDTDKLH